MAAVGIFVCIAYRCVKLFILPVIRGALWNVEVAIGIYASYGQSPVLIARFHRKWSCDLVLFLFMYGYLVFLSFFFIIRKASEAKVGIYFPVCVITLNFEQIKTSKRLKMNAFYNVYETKQCANFRPLTMRHIWTNRSYKTQR